MQIIGFKWKNLKMDGFTGWQPYFLLDDGSKLPLMQRNLSFKLGEKFCVGYVKDGKYKPCENKRKVDFELLCQECQMMDDFFRCIKCNGICYNEKQRKFCEEGNYFVYLAAFDSLLKVGITSEHRFFERLIEQGADFGVKLALVKDGLLARKIEQDVKNKLKIADRVHGDEKHRKIFGDPNKSAVEIAKAIIKLNIEPEIYDFRRYYKLQNILSTPKKLDVKLGLEMDGKVVATKGNIIIIENDGYYSVDANHMRGRTLL